MLLFSVILSCSLRMLPQTAVTSLHGTVVDPGGAVTPEADITLSNRESGFKQTRKSNAEGEYSFQQIPARQIYGQHKGGRFCATGEASRTARQSNWET